MKISDLATSTGALVILDVSHLIHAQSGWGEPLFSLINQYLIPSVSGVLLEPQLSLPALGPKLSKLGSAIQLEKVRLELDPLALPVLDSSWSVEHIANNYGVVKLGLSYNPREPKALEKKQLVAEISSYCHHLGCELMLDLQVFGLDDEGTDQNQADAMLQSVQELGRLSQLVSLSIPNDALMAATITATLDIPWVVHVPNLAQQNSTQPNQVQDQTSRPALAPKDTVRLALEAGARGAIIGTSWWAELQQFATSVNGLDWARVEQYLAHDLRDQLLELARIIEEAQEK